MQRPVTNTHDHDQQRREAQRQKQIQRNQAAIEMLKEWAQEDPEEQRETLALLMRALSERRVRAPSAG